MKAALDNEFTPEAMRQILADMHQEELDALGESRTVSGWPQKGQSQVMSPSERRRLEQEASILATSDEPFDRADLAEAQARLGISYGPQYR
jgi:hypothetical protein